MSNKCDRRAALHRFHMEAGGLYQVTVVPLRTMRKLVKAAAIGNDDANSKTEPFAELLRATFPGARSAGAQCGACKAEISEPPSGFVAISPHCDEPTTSVSFAICHKCASSEAELRVQSSRVCKSIWPDGREVVITHDHGGRS